MNHHNGSTIECATCVAVDTTACGDCVVTHVLANDAGPIGYVPATVRSSVERAVELFVRAGLIGDPVEFVPMSVFEAGGSRTPVVVGAET